MPNLNLCWSTQRMLDSIDQPIPSMVSFDSQSLPRATPVHWPTQEAHEIRMAQTSFHASGVPPGKWGKPYLSILHKYHKQTVPVSYTNIHRLRQCMQDASFALTLIYSYLCPPSRVQRHNSGWCDWESEPLPESLLLHHSRPESLSWHLCNVDHDWFISSRHIDSIYWWLVHSYQLMPWSQLLHRARGLCTPEIWDEDFFSRSDMKWPLRESTEPTACLPNLASYKNKYKYTSTYNGNDSRQNDLQTMRLTITLCLLQIASKEFLGNEMKGQ